MREQTVSTLNQGLVDKTSTGHKLVQSLKFVAPGLLLLTACGATAPTPDYTFKIANCGDSGEVEVPQGKLIEIDVPGKSATVRTNTDNSMTLGDLTAFTGGQYSIGDPVKDHMVVQVLGDTDNDGSPNLSVKSVCAVPMPSTPVSSK
ncbi:MAG: hypothetical protein NTV98_00430 [Candidatus Roizmanbacteria bacterium]|nr:hypothetical protein [Candidatus Roizmanbacteria bacterium]